MDSSALSLSEGKILKSRLSQQGSCKGKGMAVLTSGGDSQGKICDLVMLNCVLFTLHYK